MIFEANALSVRMGRRFLLHPCTFSLAPGEWKAIVGPNGAGKSTMLKAIAGLMPREGKLFLYGRQVSDDPIDFRRNIGVLFHERLLYRELTARENLDFVARLWGIPNREKEISTWLETVGLTPFAEEKVGRFSQGMTQRLALARALLPGPRLLLLDEPLASVDAEGETAIINLFAQAKQKGIAALWVTHRYEKAWALVDEIIEIDKGHIVGQTRTETFDRHSWKPRHAAHAGTGVTSSK